MKIDLNKIDKENFIIKEGIFCGEDALLVVPNHIGTKFTQENAHFRSSIWSLEGELLSAGFKKFKNFGEDPENFPVPSTLVGTSVMEKCDGSLLCVNRHNDILNSRTRGSFNTYHIDNHHEIEVLQDKYPFAFDNDILNNGNCTFLFEWVSPLNTIVLKHDEVDIRFLNIVKHENYSYYSQAELDTIAAEYGLSRPDTYTFESVSDLVESVKFWNRLEGTCIYHKKDQHIVKCKAEKYLYIHSIKSSLNTSEKLIDLFLSSNVESYSEFFNYVVNNIDYEVAIHYRSDISKIADAYKIVKDIISGMNDFVDKIKNYDTRKEQALAITSSYGGSTNNRASMVFTILDGKELNVDQKKKLFFQIMK